MTSSATSKNAIRIRLTDERWAHITEEHSELAGLRTEVLEAIGDPIRIVQGGDRRIARDSQTKGGQISRRRVS